MKDLLGKRVVLVTGKGGVGRSSMAAAFAEVARRAGKRVLLTELGDGGSDYSALAQLFGLNQLPRTAQEIAPGIHASQLMAEKGIELFLTSVLKVGTLVKMALGFEPLRRLSMATPSLRELGAFFHLLAYLRAERAPGVPEHELIIIDMPATGHTLALTGLPQVVLGLVSRGPIADALREGQSYLNDPKKAGAYVVTLPETLPISEALELVEGLEKTAMHCGGLLVNRTPSDAFSPDETTELEAFLATHALFGAHAFRRIKEARRAIDRLRRSTRRPSMRLPELDHKGAALVLALADALVAQQFQPGIVT